MTLPQDGTSPAPLDPPAPSGPAELPLSQLRTLVGRLAAFRSLALERRQFAPEPTGDKFSRRRQGRKRGADHRKNAQVTVPTGDWVWQLDPAGILCVVKDDAQVLLDKLNESMQALLAPHLDKAVKACDELALSARLAPDAVEALTLKVIRRDCLQAPLFQWISSAELCPAGQVIICPAAPDALKLEFTGPAAKDAATKMEYDSNKVLSAYAEPIQRVWQQRWYAALGLRKA